MPLNHLVLPGLTTGPCFFPSFTTNFTLLTVVPLVTVLETVFVQIIIALHLLIFSVPCQAQIGSINLLELSKLLSLLLYALTLSKLIQCEYVPYVTNNLCIKVLFSVSLKKSEHYFHLTCTCSTSMAIHQHAKQVQDQKYVFLAVYSTEPDLSFLLTAYRLN